MPMRVHTTLNGVYCVVMQLPVQRSWHVCSRSKSLGFPEHMVSRSRSPALTQFLSAQQQQMQFAWPDKKAKNLPRMVQLVPKGSASLHVYQQTVSNSSLCAACKDLDGLVGNPCTVT